MESCPDCILAKLLYETNPDYKIIDIGKQASDLKEFLALRDNHPVKSSLTLTFSSRSQVIPMQPRSGSSAGLRRQYHSLKLTEDTTGTDRLFI